MRGDNRARMIPFLRQNTGLQVLMRNLDKCCSSNNDRGSLTVLTSGLFVLLLLLSFGLIDVSNAYVAKKELLHIGEAAISNASHSLAASRYYNGQLTVAQLQSGKTEFRVPIDCSLAQSTFYSEISAESLRGFPIQVANWTCQDDVLTASLKGSISLPLQFPLLSSAIGDPISVTATIGATSLYGSS